MKKTLIPIFLETLPLLIGIFLTYLFWKNNIILLAVYLIAISIILKIKYQRGDLSALFYGFIIGLIVETIGTSVSHYQSFANPDFLGIPMWLPIVWAYGFMLMKRIGVIIYNTKVR